MFLEANFETLHKSEFLKMERLKVQDGWIVCLNRNSICFVPDKMHRWGVNNNISLDDSTVIDRLLISLDSLLSPRVSKALKDENLYLVGDIVCNDIMLKDTSFYRLKHLKNLGERSYHEIIDVLAKLGFNAPMKSDDFWKEKEKNKSKL